MVQQLYEDGGLAKEVVLGFYKALKKGDEAKVKRLVERDLEWRFYGPPKEQHLMQSLAGKKPHDSFPFEPKNVGVQDNKVFVEGAAIGEQAKCWVHVWTVEAGKLTELREYFNTGVTILLLQPAACKPIELWQSRLWTVLKQRKSLPSLILVI